MSKFVMLSVSPKWCELIANRKKTIEVRKSRPKIATPFKCYIYCTKDRGLTFYRGRRYCYADDHSHNAFDVPGNGTIIGKFVCDRISPIYVLDNGSIRYWNYEHIDQACLSYGDLAAYIGGVGKRGFGWHISDLKIYDNPRELREFKKIKRDCFYADLGLAKRECLDCKNSGCFLERPPQSWCYAEELNDG